MRNYQFKIPRGYILPGLLGFLLLIVIVSVGMVLFAVVLAALVVIGIGSAIYRALFPAGNRKSYRQQSIYIRRTQADHNDDIPFTDYKEIESGSEKDIKDNR